MGWAVVEREGSRETLVKCGCLETKSKSPMPARLKKIFEVTKELITENAIDEVAVEELFFFKNAKTVMQVALARGVVIVVAELCERPVYQYTPLQVKSAVAGFGRADKKQVEYMVKQLLRLKEAPKPDDVADAAAVALTHLAMGKAYRRMVE